MARLPTIVKLVVEEFKDQKAWIGKLLSTLNDFMTAVNSALNRSLTIKENMAADMRTVELDGTMPLKLSWDLKVRPRAVLVGDCYRSDATAITLTNAVGIRWSFNQSGQLQIDQVVGISPSSTARYKLELVAFTG